MREDHEQINEWVNTYSDELLNWAVHKVSDTENAKDIVQDTFLAVAKNYDNFKQKSNPKTWIYSILNNKISDYYRKKYRQSSKVDFDTISAFFTATGDWKSDKLPIKWQNDDLHLLDDPEFLDILNFCLNDLPHKFNALILMKYYSEKKTNEICQELDINPTNMWQMMHRAKLKLRECIENGWFKN